VILGRVGTGDDEHHVLGVRLGVPELAPPPLLEDAFEQRDGHYPASTDTRAVRIVRSLAPRRLPPCDRIART
jgi:hypothetical protein